MEATCTLVKAATLQFRQEGTLAKNLVVETTSLDQENSEVPVDLLPKSIEKIEEGTLRIIWKPERPVRSLFDIESRHETYKQDYIQPQLSSRLSTFGEVKLNHPFFPEHCCMERVGKDAKDQQQLLNNSPVSATQSDTELLERIFFHRQQAFECLMSPPMSPHLQRPDTKIGTLRACKVIDTQFASPSMAPTLDYLAEPDSGSSIPKASRHSAEACQNRSSLASQSEGLGQIQRSWSNSTGMQEVINQHSAPSPISGAGLLAHAHITDPNTPDFGSRQPDTPLVSMGRNPACLKPIQIACSAESNQRDVVKSPDLNLFDRDIHLEPKNSNSNNAIESTEAKSQKLKDTRNSLQKISLKLTSNNEPSAFERSAPARPEIKFNYKIGGIPSPQGKLRSSNLAANHSSVNVGSETSANSKRAKLSISNVPVWNSRETPKAISDLSDISGLTQEGFELKLHLVKRSHGNFEHHSMKLIKEFASGTKLQDQSQRCVITSTPEVPPLKSPAEVLSDEVDKIKRLGNKNTWSINVSVAGTYKPSHRQQMPQPPVGWRLRVIMLLPALLLLVEALNMWGIGTY